MGDSTQVLLTRLAMDTAQGLQAVSFLVAAYFLKQFVDGVKELTKTVQGMDKRLGNVEVVVGMRAPEQVGELTPFAQTPTRPFHRRD